MLMRRAAAIVCSALLFPFSVTCLVLLLVRSAQGFFAVGPYLGFPTTPLAGVVLTSGPDRGLSKSAFVRST